MIHVVQSIYRVLPDRNRLISSRAEEMSQLQTLGLDLLKCLPGKAYWALLRDAEQPLVSLYRVAEDEEASQPIPQEILERPQVQHNALRLWHLLTPLLDREETGPRAFWVLISKEPVIQSGPPAFRLPGEFPLDSQGFSGDDLLSQLTSRFQKSVPELPEQLRDRLELLGRILENVESNHGPHWEDFYRGVASAIGLQFGGELAERLAQSQPLPQPVPSPLRGKEEEARDDSLLDTALTVDPLIVEIATPLAVLVNPEQGSSLFNRIGRIRRNLIYELGIVLPSVRFRDHPDLGSNGYRIKLRDQEVGRGQVYPRKELAVAEESRLNQLQGLKTVEPTYFLPAMWIDPSLRAQAQALGAVVFDPVTVITVHFTEIIRRHAGELLTLEEASKLLQRREHSLVFSALQRRGIDEVLIWQVLQELLNEQVCIRDLTLILQALLEASGEPVEALSERARRALRRQITLRLVSEGEPLPAIVLSPEQEDLLTSGQGDFLIDQLLLHQDYFDGLSKRPVFVTSPHWRRTLRDLLKARLPAAEVVTRGELLSWVTLVGP